MLTAPGKITVRIPGKLKNPMNAREHYLKHARTAKDWRERTCQHLLFEAPSLGSPSLAKRVTFILHAGGTWDDDNIQAAVKPIRDGLVDGRVIDSDAPSAGHVFLYEQVVDRQWRGVEIVVELAP